MRRTANRALPSGRLAPSEAAVFGGLLVFAGHGDPALGANLLAAAVAFVTFLLYVFVYTPLKPWTTLNTVIGAVPGALPPVIGWAAATGRLGHRGLGLVPDRLPLAVPPLPGDRLDLSRRLPACRVPDADRPAMPGARMTGCQAVSYALALVPVGLLPATVGLAGPVYFAGALLAGSLVSGRRRSVLARGRATCGPAGCCVRRLSTCPRS